MTSEYGMRASDRDREHAVEVLRSAYAAGRLDLAELHDRTGAACSARTWRDLRGLIADLPEAQALVGGGLGAGQPGGAGGSDTAGGSDGAAGRPFLPMVVMACIWLSIAAVGHVAAAIPLVLLSMFVLSAAAWRIPPSSQLEARVMRPEGNTMLAEARPAQPARPGWPGRPDVAVPAARDMEPKVTTRYCSLTAPRRRHCRRGR